MIYRYKDRNMVQFSNGTRASYSAKRYGDLLERITQESHDQDKKLWNVIETCGEITYILYWHLKQSKVVKIMIDTDGCEIAKECYWRINHNGYPYAGHKEQSGGLIYLYRVIMNCHDMSLVVDHINRNPLDNRKNNLRIVTPLENARNQTLPPNRVGFRGIDMRGGKYRMRINNLEKETIDKKFDTLEEAIQERLRLEKLYGYLRMSND